MLRMVLLHLLVELKSGSVPSSLGLSPLDGEEDVQIPRSFSIDLGPVRCHCACVHGMTHGIMPAPFNV